MTNDILKIIRIILLLLLAAFLVLFIYKYFASGELYTSYLMPIAGLAVFYILTGQKAT